ncbi:MAG: GNAT family protein [Pseudomonadota bacterium]
MGNALSIYLRKPDFTDQEEIIAAFTRSVDLHNPWTYSPDDYEKYLSQPYRYFVCHKKTHAILGSYNISEIVRGWFQSAYLGYEVFAPHQRQGFMTQGMTLILEEAFAKLNLHRLEANIQSHNYASIALVLKSGFTNEGFSPKYLRIGGKEWQDHERWAIVNDSWVESNP